MDTNRTFRSTTRLARLSLAAMMLAVSAAPALGQGGSPVAADSAAAKPAPAVPAPAVPAPAAPVPAAPAPAAPAARALGCADGERDADTHHDPVGYLIGGAVTGPIGVGYAIWRRPQPRVSALAGQPPGASVEYSRCYAARARRKNIKAASNGFAVTAIVAMVAIAFADSKTAP